MVKLLRRGWLTSSQPEIDVRGILDGIYILYLKGAETISIERFIKNNLQNKKGGSG
ncbi:hypothetical protein ADICEAN_00249 [Cesiribacter andamanensis AMV16]|uniref:Uncharacterized protein n=1 Tax=Cesiribacter andamanensis AMV16 TaxID=1279009 RepID=M7NBT4_9BACT|nr:hypothetical protein ADICEAN_00249 [Cesiribacter andamanensis AMV16]